MAANTGQTAPDDNWLNKLQEDILEPDIAIVDPHHHLWLRNGYTYLLPELAADMASGHRIVASVFAECHSMYRQRGPLEERSLGETEFVRGQAAMSASGGFGSARACDVMFGNVDVMLGDKVEPLLEKHVEFSGGSFRGIRISSGWHSSDLIQNVSPDAQLLMSPQVDAVAAVLTRMDMTLDIWVYHTQLQEVAALADKHPDLTIVLNHVGSPILGGPYRGKTAEVFEEWRGLIAEVARRQNVFVKLGALPIRMPDYSGDRTLPPGSIEVAAAWQSWVDFCIEAFSPSRAMFESNFPVQKRWCSYQVCWNAFKRLAMYFSHAEKSALFAGSAAHAYRMEGVLKSVT
ncbi:MAG: amidohydrolase family protein [Pseudomonadaceae bacterium]|nr:amidohydrolase family protein [Pseudomonadaceae bacterium]